MKERLASDIFKEMLEALFPERKFEESDQFWKASDLLDEYIDKRIEDRLDQEFSRGQYQSDY